jgi:hypothetical protein
MTPEEAERWRVAHQAELDRRAEERRREKADARAARSSEYADARASRADRVEDRQAAKAERSKAWMARADPVNDPHVIAMAEAFRHTEASGIPGYEVGAVGCTPQEFIDWQKRQREMMRHPQTQAELDEVMRSAR